MNNREGSDDEQMMEQQQKDVQKRLYESVHVPSQRVYTQPDYGQLSGNERQLSDINERVNLTFSRLRQCCPHNHYSPIQHNPPPPPLYYNTIQPNPPPLHFNSFNHPLHHPPHTNHHFSNTIQQCCRPPILYDPWQSCCQPIDNHHNDQQSHIQKNKKKVKDVSTQNNIKKKQINKEQKQLDELNESIKRSNKLVFQQQKIKNNHQFKMNQKDNQQYIDYYEYAKQLYDSQKNDYNFIQLFNNNYCYEELFMPQVKDLELIRHFLKFIIEYIDIKNARQQEEYNNWQYQQQQQQYQQQHQQPQQQQTQSKQTYCGDDPINEMRKEDSQQAKQEYYDYCKPKQDERDYKKLNYDLLSKPKRVQTLTGKIGQQHQAKEYKNHKSVQVDRNN